MERPPRYDERLFNRLLWAWAAPGARAELIALILALQSQAAGTSAYARLLGDVLRELERIDTEGAGSDGD